MKKLFTLLFGLTLVLGLKTGANAYDYIHFTLPDQWDYCCPHLVSPWTAPWDDTALFISPIAYQSTSNILYVIKNGINYTTNGYLLGQDNGAGISFVSQATLRAAMPDPDSILSGITADARQLFNVVSKADPDYDSFTNRSKFLSIGYYNPDLTWNTFATGYLLDATADPSDATLGKMGRIHFPQSVIASPTMIKMYNTKWSADLYLLRKIDVRRADAEAIANRTTVSFEVGATEASHVSDDAYWTYYQKRTRPLVVVERTLGTYGTVKTIQLDQFLSTYVCEDPSYYSYTIVGLNSTKSYTYTQMTLAYYLPDYDLLVQVDGSNNPITSSKVNYPVRIELTDYWDDAYNWSVNPPPGYAVIP